jgi:hypothetical protein
MQGDYTIWLKDSSQPDAHQSVIFKVEKPQQFENPRLDEDLLKSVAKSGGDGGSISASSGQRDSAKDPAARRKVPRETTIDLWDNWAVLLLFTLAITAEWILRKWADDLAKWLRRGC